MPYGAGGLGSRAVQGSRKELGGGGGGAVVASTGVARCKTGGYGAASLARETWPASWAALRGATSCQLDAHGRLSRREPTRRHPRAARPSLGTAQALPTSVEPGPRAQPAGGSQRCQVCCQAGSRACQGSGGARAGAARRPPPAPGSRQPQARAPAPGSIAGHHTWHARLALAPLCEPRRFCCGVG